MKRSEALRTIRTFYTNGGRIRRKLWSRMLNEYRQQTYKKGYEIRIKVKNDIECDRLRQSLLICGIKAGKPYKHHSYEIVPIYGKKQVEWFEKQIIYATYQRHSRGVK